MNLSLDTIIRLSDAVFYETRLYFMMRIKLIIYCGWCCCCCVHYPGYQLDRLLLPASAPLIKQLIGAPPPHPPTNNHINPLQPTYPNPSYIKKTRQIYCMFSFADLRLLSTFASFFYYYYCLHIRRNSHDFSSLRG
jgi:hypothetical protein